MVIMHFRHQPGREYLASRTISPSIRTLDMAWHLLDLHLDTLPIAAVVVVAFRNSMGLLVRQL